MIIVSLLCFVVSFIPCTLQTRVCFLNVQERSQFSQFRFFYFKGLFWYEYCVIHIWNQTKEYFLCLCFFVPSPGVDPAWHLTTVGDCEYCPVSCMCLYRTGSFNINICPFSCWRCRFPSYRNFSELSHSLSQVPENR